MAYIAKGPSIACAHNRRLVELFIYFGIFFFQLQLYALGERTIFTEHNHVIPFDQKGYSVYYYDSTTSSKYCVIKHEHYYATQRHLLNIASVLVILFTVVGFPFLFVELYQPVIDMLKDTNQENDTSRQNDTNQQNDTSRQNDTNQEKNSSGSAYWRFITWSVVIVSLIVNILILVNNVFVLNDSDEQYDSTSRNLVFAITVICYFVGIIDFLSCLAAIGYLDWFKSFPKDLPLPLLLEKTCKPDNNCCTRANDVEQGSSQGNHENRSTGTCSCHRKGCCLYSIAIAFGYAIFVHFLQLISFHTVYIILGAIASPFETLSVLCNYVTGYLFAVIYIAVILKYMDKVYFIKHSQNGVEQQDCCAMLRILSLNVMCCIIPLITGGILLIASVALFTAFFYKFTEVMELTNQNEGVVGVVKSFLPSLFVSLLGFFGHKILKRISRSSRSSSEENREGSSQAGNTPRGSTSATPSISHEVSGQSMGVPASSHPPQAPAGSGQQGNTSSGSASATSSVSPEISGSSRKMHSSQNNDEQQLLLGKKKK